MTDRDRRRQLRDQARQQPPDAGVYVLRHRVTGRSVVSSTLNLAGARNRFDHPTPESLIALITDRYQGVFVTEAMHAWFCSLNEQSWPNFATIVTTDEHDDASDLDRPGRFRLNIGVSGATFDRVVGGVTAPDFTATDVLVPHPVYAAQHWISIVNPSTATLATTLLPLIDEAYGRLAAQEARHRRA